MTFRDLPEHVQKVIESDIRDAVIKLCIGELDNQKRLEKAQSVIKIGTLADLRHIFVRPHKTHNYILKIRSPGIQRRDIIQQWEQSLRIA